MTPVYDVCTCLSHACICMCVCAFPEYTSVWVGMLAVCGMCTNMHVHVC